MIDHILAVIVTLGKIFIIAEITFYNLKNRKRYLSKKSLSQVSSSEKEHHLVGMFNF